MLELMSISDWILIAIDKAIWGIFITGPLNLISAFSEVLRYLAGGIIWDLLFGGSQTFSLNRIPSAFYGFCILAAFLVVLIFIIQFIVMQFGDEKDLKFKLIKAIKMTGLGVVIVFFIPICFFLLNALVVFLNLSLNSVFGMNDNNIADAIYNIGNPNWDGHTMPSPGNYGPPDDILNWNIMAEVFGVWFMTFAIFMLGLALVQKIFELFFLFLIGPIVACTMVNDDGKRMLTWKDYVISKSIASVGTLISYYVFMIAISLVLSRAMNQFSNFARQLMTILFICGGALATLGMSHLVAAFVGESVGISEGLSSIRSTMAAGMFTMGAAKMVGRAIGFGRAKGKQMDKNGSFFGGSGGAGAGIDQSAISTFAEQNTGTDKVMDDGSRGIQYKPMQNRSGLIGIAGRATTGAAMAAAGSIFAIRQSYKTKKEKALQSSAIKAYMSGGGRAASFITHKDATGRIVFGGYTKSVQKQAKRQALTHTITKAPMMPVSAAGKVAGSKIKDVGRSIKNSSLDAGKIHYSNLKDSHGYNSKTDKINQFNGSEWVKNKKNNNTKE